MILTVILDLYGDLFCKGKLNKLVSGVQKKKKSMSSQSIFPYISNNVKFKDFSRTSKTFLLFSGTKNLRKMLIYSSNSTSEILDCITNGISSRKLV